MKETEKKLYVYQGIVMLMICLAMFMVFGKMVFGNIISNSYGTYSDLTKLKIEKIWDEGVDESDIPDVIVVEFEVLVRNPDAGAASPNEPTFIPETRTETLSKNNDWKVELSGYGSGDEEGCILKNSFEEVKVNGFKSYLSEDENKDTYYVKIINKKIEPTEPEEPDPKPTESEPTTPEESEPEPTEPTEPTNPTDPTDPTDPSEPHKPGGGGNSGGGGGGGSSSGGGGTPGKPVTPVTPQTQEPQTPDETPGDVPPAPWYKLPVMGDEQFGPGFINDSSNQVTLPENQAAANQQSIIPQLAELYAQNNELAGWLTVPGTGFGYPVMLSQNEPYYYQHHTFEKQLDEVGIPFMGPYCTKDSMNVLIHGHNMRDVSQFGYIWNYQYPEFQKKNPTIDFKTLTDENGSYEVMAVFFAPEYGEGTENVFWWYRYTGDMNRNQFDYFVQNAKALSLYDTGVTAEYGDKLITLETCASSKDSTRLVVVARKKAAQTAAVTQ